MSFASETENLVEQLIQAEYKNACEKFGDKYHSLHEGWAVLLEEIEEFNDGIIDFNLYKDKLWEEIKGNCTPLDTVEWLEADLKVIMKELAQVGAVLQKIKKYFGEVK